MVDNVAITAGSGTTIAADDIGAGVLAQRVKPVWGPDGTGNDVDVASGKSFPVQVRSATGLIPIGEPTDAKSTATDTTSVSGISIWKQISASVQLFVFGAGTAAAAQRTTLASDDPAVATLGATSGAAVITDVNGTIQQYLRGLIKLALSGFATVGRDLLYDTGTNGFIATLTLTSGSDLASLASGGAVTLAGGGAAGVSSQANTGSGKRGYVMFKTVTAGFTPTGGGVISGWWLNSDDGGTTYESTPATPSATVPALARPPDFVIPLDAAALGTTAVKWSYPCKLPEGTFKVLVQNNSGAAFGAGNYSLTLKVPAEKN